MSGWIRWSPAAVFLAGSVLLYGLGDQKALPLRASLEDVVPETTGRFATSEDVEVSDSEARVAGFSDYLMRNYEGAGGTEDWASLYVGYYESQTQGKTIHSPKNCLPGGGWEPLMSRVERLQTPSGESFDVNRYVLQREGEQALVLYWYQGRGRVAHNEYAVKWDLLRDAALRRRSDEALVRIVVPITTTEDEAFETARTLALEAKPAVDQALPL